MKILIHIYTDGSCLRNPGPGGFAAIIKEEKKEIILKGGEKLTTNNRMEMQALLSALKWLKDEQKFKSNIHIYADSQLLINSLNNRGWKRKANLDLWALIDQARDNLNIEYHWVKGHAGQIENERCNRLAIEEARRWDKG